MRSRPASPTPTGEPAQPPQTGEAGRFNVLLTFGGWQTDSWADRLPTLLAPMGVTCLRATAASEAADLLRTTRVHLAVVDLRLPLSGPGLGAQPSPVEEGGPRVLELLRRLEQPPPTVVVRRNRSTRDDAREMEAALRAGAFAVIDQPVDLELMLKTMSRALERFYAGRWPGHGHHPAAGPTRTVRTGRPMR